MARKLAHYTPGRILFFTFCFTVIAGTLLLALPFARTTEVPLIDLFFTATSATTGTGLFTTPLDSFTFFGHCVILALIQIGGLGLITLTLFLLSLFVDLGLATTFMAVQLLEMETWKNIQRFILFIVGFTFTLELAGAIGTFIAIHNDYPLGRACFLSCFHAISSFCNAGITLFDNGMGTYATNYTMLITTSFLMLFGGLGFITWNELINYFASFKHKKRYAFSLHSKLVLYGSAIIIGLGSVLFLLLETNPSLETMNPFTKAISTLFHVISFRSAGFLALPITTFNIATMMLIGAIAFIGSSPGSTGCGIKITTFSIFLATIKAATTGNTIVQIYGRRIELDQILKVMAIVFLSIMWIFFSTFLLVLVETDQEFFDLLFETLSAFATLGITSGATSALSAAGKCIIMASMTIGKIGSLTMILALKRKKSEQKEFLYPEERVMLS